MNALIHRQIGIEISRRLSRRSTSGLLSGGWSNQENCDEDDKSAKAKAEQGADQRNLLKYQDTVSLLYSRSCFEWARLLAAPSRCVRSHFTLRQATRIRVQG